VGMAVDDVSKVRFGGPLAEYRAGFAAESARLGYTPHSATCQVVLAAHLSRWLSGGSGVGILPVSEFSEDTGFQERLHCRAHKLDAGQSPRAT
jgi:hypothetical protein